MDVSLAAGGQLDLASAPAGRLELPVADLRSGNPLYDRELHRRVDARRHPVITADLVVLDHGSAPDRYRATGDVTFHGVTRRYDDGELRITIAGDDTVHIEGQHTFDVRDFGLEPPRLLTLRVQPEVEVTIQLVARPEEPASR